MKAKQLRFLAAVIATLSLVTLDSSALPIAQTGIGRALHASPATMQWALIANCLTWAVLTPQGRATIEAVAPHHVAGVREYFLDAISAQELATIATAFTRVNDQLGPGGGCLGEQCPGTGGPSAS